MFTVTVETGFTAGHQLGIGQDRTEPVHEHKWLIRTSVSVAKLDKTGLAMDFTDLKSITEKVTSTFDGSRLEQLPCFHGLNVSAETLARYIHDKIEPLLPSNIKLRCVEVVEEPGCMVKYSK